MRRIHAGRFDLLFPSYLLLSVLALWVGGAHWLGEWQWTIDNINGVTVLLGPYAAAAAAWMVWQTETNSVLYASASRGWMVPIRAGIRVWLSAAVAWALAGASGIIGTGSVVHGGPFPWWALMAGPVVLVTCIAIGVAAAHQWPSRIVAILVAPALFVVGGLGANGVIPDLLRQGPGTASLAGLQWDAVNFLFEMLALLLIATVGVLVASRRRDAISVRDIALPVSAAVAFVIVSVLSHVVSPQRFVASSEQPTLCSATVPVVCVAASNARALASLSRVFSEFTPAVYKLGFAMPASFREVLPNHAGGAAWGDLNLGAQANDPNASAQEVVTALVTPGDCLAYYDPVGAPSSVVYQAQNMLAEMVTRVSAGNLSDLAHPWLIAWARATYLDLRQCRLNAIKLPAGP